MIKTSIAFTLVLAGASSRCFCQHFSMVYPRLLQYIYNGMVFVDSEDLPFSLPFDPFLPLKLVWVDSAVSVGSLS